MIASVTSVVFFSAVVSGLRIRDAPKTKPLYTELQKYPTELH